MEQQALAEYFARPAEKKTGDVDVSFTISPHGGAIVDGSLAHMDCHVVTETVAGDHTIFIGEIDEIDVYDGDSDEPLIFFEGKFGQLSDE